MQLSSKSILADTSGAELPAPVSMSIGDEIIWSENTGRTSSGCAVGTVIAEKQTVNITWGILPGEGSSCMAPHLYRKGPGKAELH